MGMAGVCAFAVGGLSRFNALAQSASSGRFYNLAGIGELQAPDSNGVRLPPGFASKVVARSGQVAAAGSEYQWHDSPDGGACFAAEDGGWVYVSNSEVRGGLGGVGALRFNSGGDIVDTYSILENTSQNCAGGATPWGTWLSCEEVDAGQVYECDPYGNKQAILRPALGTFKHEAVAVDIPNNCIYLTEDVPDGGLYRFVARNPLPDISEGQLEIADVSGGKISWQAVPDPLAIETPTRYQAADYTAFKGGEGIALHETKVFFSTKRDNRVWCFDTNTLLIDVIYDAADSDNPILTGVDNLLISPAGDVLVAEDEGDLQIVVITPEHELVPILQVVGHEQSELCGPAFDPSYQRLYFSSQRGAEGTGSDGVTYEISYVGS